jgi:hypothetical protein
MRMRLHIRRAAIVLALAAAVTHADEAAAQTANVAGTWNLQVVTDQGTTTPTLTLVQDGDELTGRYSSATLGEAEVTGTVTGSSFTVTLNASMQGQSIPVTYTGALGADGKLTGKIDIAGGMMGGDFTGTRAGG